MHIREALLKEHSRAQAEKIAKWIGKDPDRFASLIQLFLHDEYRVVQRAAWVLSLVAEKYPEIARPHLPAMVQRMAQPGVPVAVKRNVVRTLQFLPIPEALHGEVMNTCFGLLTDPQETIAVRAFSMTVLANLARQYPDIKQELKTIIEDALQHNPSPGLSSRARKVLKQLTSF